MEKWTPAVAGSGFEMSQILRTAHAVPKSAHDREQHRQQAGRKPRGTRAGTGLTWLSCAHPHEGLEPAHVGDGRSDRRPAHRPGHAVSRRLEIATAQGHGVGSACERGYGCSYSAPCRSETLRRRCLLKAVRVSCSCVCSARAIRLRSASSSRSRRAAFST